MPFRSICVQQVFCKCWLCMLAQLTDLFSLYSSEAKVGSAIKASLLVLCQLELCTQRPTNQ